MMTTTAGQTALLLVCLVWLAAADETATDVTPTVVQVEPTVAVTTTAVDSRARILFEEQADEQQDPNILILGSQQTPNFPTIRPAPSDDKAPSNNDWTPIVWPSTRLPVSAVVPSLVPPSTVAVPRSTVVVRPTQIVDRLVPSIVTPPARIVSSLPTRTVAPTGSSPRIRIPAPISVTRFDFGDVATSRPSSESPASDSAIAPSAPVPSQVPTSTESSTQTSTEATSASSVTEQPTTTPLSATPDVQNVTSPTTAILPADTSPDVPADTSSPEPPTFKVALNESEPIVPPVAEEVVTDAPPFDSSPFIPSVAFDTNLVDTPANETDALIVDELEATVTDPSAVIDEDSVTTDLVAELESVNGTLIGADSSPFSPSFDVNQTLTSTTSTEASTSQKAPIVSSVDVTSSTAPTNALDETTPPFIGTTPATDLKTDDPEEVTGRSAAPATTLSGVLSTLFPALTRAPSIATQPPTTRSPPTTVTTTTTAIPVTTTHVNFPPTTTTFWTNPTQLPPTPFAFPAQPFAPHATTDPPTTTFHFHDEHSTHDWTGSTEPARGDNSANSTIIAASVSVAVVVFLAILLLLFLVMRRRKARAVQGTCQPARMDAFSLENVSETNTWQRGKVRNSLRASKRSYLNQAFDDSAVFSVPLTAAQLALYMEKPITSIEAEFRNVATSSVRIDELPPGVETKNRYANVLPVPETRVHIRVTDNRPEDILEQYINANYIRGPKEEARYYIACQGPMEHTVEDFWHMVWENQCRLIVQLTDLTENGVARCAEYLPPSEVLDCHRLYGDYQVTLKSRELRDKYVTSSVQLKRMEDNLVREITHLWYSSWPATGVPEDGKTVVELLLEARKGQSKEQQAPVVVHCSPGTGRTGAVLAIDVCMRQLDSSRSIDIPRCVHRLRQDRAGCVQTGEQYAFIYKAVSFYASQLSNAALDSL